MLTGDRRSAAEAIAREAGIPNVEAGLLPEQKLSRIRELARDGLYAALWRRQSGGVLKMDAA